MKRLILLVVLGLAMVAAACTEPETYPLSGAECHEDDPVQEMGPLDCV